MAHHRRGKPKAARAGCLLCKPHKIHGNARHAIPPAVLRRRGGDLLFERRYANLGED